MYYIQDYEGAIESFTGAIWHGERYGAEYNYRTEPNSVLPENSSVKTDFTQNVFPLPYKSFANSYYNRGIVKRLLKDDEGAESDFSRANRIQSLAKTSSIP